MTIMKPMQAIYMEFMDIIDKNEDKFTADMFLLNSLKTNILILVLWFAFVLKIGPWYMKYRKPFNIDKFIFAYNVFQIVVCSTSILIMAKYVFSLNPFCRSGAYVPIASHAYVAGYVYYIFKMIDLLDTVFIVLRKKYNQITFLHLFHHSSMVVGSWAAMKFATHEHISFIPYINTTVHAVMYSYYMLSMYHKNNKRILWWKKYMTQLQLAQFTILFFIYLPALIKKDCAFPKPFAFLITVQNSVIMALFLNFYYQTYIKKKVSTDLNNSINSDVIKLKIK